MCLEVRKIFNINISDLNDLELDVYKYILENKEKVVYMTIRELADEVHVSTATILRFCKKNNFSGFSEFKSFLKSNLKEEKVSTAFEKIDYFDEFSKNMESINEQVDELKEVIKNKDTILFIGIGSSGAMASYAAKYMSYFGKFSIYIDDPFYPINTKSLNNSMAIILSVSGENSSIIGMVEKLKSLGVETLSITNKRSNTLAKLTDYTINYYISQERYYYEAGSSLEYNDVTSHIPTVYIIERLARNCRSNKVF